MLPFFLFSIFRANLRDKKKIGSMRFSILVLRSMLNLWGRKEGEMLPFFFDSSCQFAEQKKIESQKMDQFSILV